MLAPSLFYLCWFGEGEGARPVKPAAAASKDFPLWTWPNLD